jgi:uncharacterized membrane protein
MVVAGPWLMSILTIAVLFQVFEFRGLALGDLFIGVVVYSYAISLVVFTGVHMLFTRILADKIWEDKHGEASTFLMSFSIILTLVTGALGFSLVFFWDLSFLGEIELLFKLSAVSFFVFLNLFWVLMLFISLLRWYGRILMVFAFGMIASVVMAYYLSEPWGVGGGMLGFALGHGLVILVLYLFSFQAYPPANVLGQGEFIWKTFKKFWPLVAAGGLFQVGQWLDKMMYWFLQNPDISGIRLYPAYDTAVYLANLSLIPGLVFFVIVSETRFYSVLNRFLVSIIKAPYAAIQRKKVTLLRSLDQNLRDQGAFQAMVTVILILISDQIGALFQLDPLVLRLAFLTAYLLLFFLTIMNFMYYFEYYKMAATVSLTLVLLNAGFTFLTILFDLPPGLGILLALVILVPLSYGALKKGAQRLDQVIFTR